MPQPAAAAVSASTHTQRTNTDGAEQRRPASRHFHCGPRPVKGTDSGSGSGSSSAGTRSPSGPPPTTAVILHRHALESMFVFLDLRELAAALRVARGWLSAVGSMGRLGLQVRDPGPSSLVELAASALGRHVAELNSVRIHADNLLTVVDQLAHLRALRCTLYLPLHDWAPRFPAQLRLLELYLFGRVDAAEINAAIAAIAQLPLLVELTVTLPALDPHLSFAPLAALPLLRSLGVGWDRYQDKLSDAQVDELRAMPRLQKLRILPALPLLRRLLRQPHNLQWQQISLPGWLGDETAELLPQLPSLTKINEYVSFDWLRGLPNLTDVSLRLYIGAEGRAASLAAALQCCARIEILGLICRDLTAAQLTDLLPRLPKLRQLLLGDLRVDSLAFLAQPPLTSQLISLEQLLSDCRRLPPGELGHVLALRGLTQLTVHESFIVPLDAEIQALLTPPSLLLPRLEKFEYEAR